MGPLGSDRGVLPVARADPGLVGQRSEEPLLDVVDQAGEPLRILLGVADPAGEQELSGHQAISVTTRRASLRPCLCAVLLVRLMGNLAQTRCSCRSIAAHG